uniref:Glucose-methanol-choline oxidoreductase N-terminal domain-containing protein n=1 Tax=Oryza barthii TaxID=65489 RepID=A0A0D3FD23_9ORYZ
MAPGHRHGSVPPVVLLLLVATVLGSLCLSLTASPEAQKRYNFRFVRHARDAPLVSYYNYIVVGGGTAGCPLAATLSERSRVLLLERGGLPYGNRNVSSEYHFADALADTSPRSPAQRFVSEDGVVNARARVLGGGSCLNAGFYTRASSGYVRAAGWDPRLVNASYRWVERELVFRPDVPRWQCALREGLLQAGVTPDNGYTLEHVQGTKIGGTIFDRAGRRHTAADFLRRAYPRRLTVFLRATVSQILFRRTGTQTGQLRTVPPKERTPEAMRRLDRRAFRGGFILEKILGPMSTGHVALRSADPDANPAVTFNYFRDPRDVERCVRGIETIERVVRSRAFARFTYANVTAMEAAVLGRRAGHLPVNLLPRRATDTRPLQQYCRETVMTIWHYHGGCHVGAVVDQDYRVLGVRGLRVVDSSTFKYSPGTNPQATVMMLGRYMGLKIQKERWTRNDETH